MKTRHGEPTYLLSNILDDAAALCTQHKSDPDFKRGVIALLALTVLPEVEDSDTAQWIMGLAVDEAMRS